MPKPSPALACIGWRPMSLPVEWTDMSEGLAILYVEDSESDFRLIERELKRAGLIRSIRRVDTRAELHAALSEGKWDLVLTDYSVPGMNFTETLAYFKNQRPDLPLILVSATIGEVKAAAMVKLGARAFVSKESLRELAPTILRLLK